jgi:predicted amidophosphoribosyltransferase
MKQCLACWEEIEDQERICNHCGSDQDEVKDYLALVLLKQRKKKIEIPEQTAVLDYVFDVDPSTAESITVSKTSAGADFQEARPTPGTTYKPDSPSWLGRPTTQQTSQPTQSTQPTAVNQKPSTPAVSRKKLIRCPKCSKEVSFLKYCKNCGQQLQRECPSCNIPISVTSKFCTSCGKPVEPMVEK